jgi:hypothetical protein
LGPTREILRTRASRAVLLLAAACGLTLGAGCKETYRVGDLVLVDWCEGEYSAYVVARKGRTRYRVHFDGYESRWDTDITHDKIKRRLEEPLLPAPPLCAEVARALGIQQPEKGAPALYQPGAHIKVTWRGSVYKATVLAIEGPNRFKVHYEGHDDAWDEVISGDRVVGGN